MDSLGSCTLGPFKSEKSLFFRNCPLQEHTAGSIEEHYLLGRQRLLRLLFDLSVLWAFLSVLVSPVKGRDLEAVGEQKANGIHVT